MEKRKIAILNKGGRDLNSIYNLLGKSEDELPFSLELDYNTPDYIMVNESLYYEKPIFNEFKRLYNDNCVTIFQGGECIEPDLNIFDYADIYNDKLKCGDRIIRRPTRAGWGYSGKTNSITSIDQAKEELSKKDFFCNFIYTNGKGAQYRTDLFYAVNNYKSVDSLGRYLNNKKSEQRTKTTPISILIANSIKLKSQYKFTIACENACFPGYTSEKLQTSFAAHSVPIYWGNPDIEEEINGKAFINCHKYANLDEVVQRVKEIDEDDDLWCEMLCQPWLTPEQEEKEKKGLEEAQKMFANIFLQPLEKAKRRGYGFHCDNYKRWFFERYPFNLKKTVKRIIKK